jgi:AhpC/TSA family
MRTLVHAGVLLLAAAVFIGCLTTSTGLSRGKPAPDIHGSDADGRQLQLSDYRGKVVLLDFWASY